MAKGECSHSCEGLCIWLVSHLPRVMSGKLQSCSDTVLRCCQLSVLVSVYRCGPKARQRHRDAGNVFCAAKSSTWQISCPSSLLHPLFLGETIFVHVSEEKRLCGNERRKDFMASKVKLAGKSSQGTALSNFSFQYFAENKIQWSPRLEGKSRHQRSSGLL